MADFFFISFYPRFCFYLVGFGLLFLRGRVVGIFLWVLLRACGLFGGVNRENIEDCWYSGYWYS